MQNEHLYGQPRLVYKAAKGDVSELLLHECQPAEKYNGQWQGDKQRTA
jgi:hypothetical protein